MRSIWAQKCNPYSAMTLCRCKPPRIVPAQAKIPAFWSWANPSSRPEWERAVNVDMMMNMEIMLWAAENGGNGNWSDAVEGWEGTQMLLRSLASVFFSFVVWVREKCINSEMLCRVQYSESGNGCCLIFGWHTRHVYKYTVYHTEVWNVYYSEDYGAVRQAFVL